MSGESVYCLIEEQQSAASKSKMYRSKHSHQVPPSYSTFGTQGTSQVYGNVAAGTKDQMSVHPAKKGAGSFGKSVVASVDPHNFLKKTNMGSTGKGESQHQQHYSPATFKRGPEGEKKPAVPKREEKPVMGLSTDKNFVVANAVENILAVPKKQAAQETRAVDKNTYGRVPTYIQKTKAELQKQYALVDKFGASGKQVEDKFTQLSAGEVSELRAGLQKRWDILNKEFQTMGFNLETRTQKKRQETVEGELRALEAALAKVNKPNIFIYNDGM